jgi:hypothetical protein
LNAEDEAMTAGRALRLPTYRLERVNVAVLNVDYAPPHGIGYARPLSPYRLRQLRNNWDPLAVSPMTLSRRADGSLWIIDGNHRRYVAYDMGMLQLPAMVHSGLAREQEADLYTKLGTVLGQTPWTRFQSKLAAGDQAARDIAKIAARYKLKLNGDYGRTNNSIQAVARCEWIYARGGPDGLNWVFAFLVHAFDGDRDSLGEQQLEGTYGFYVRYAELVNRDEVARMLGASGIPAWTNRADSVWQHSDVGRRGNTYGAAIAAMVNDTWRKRGIKVKDLLPAWEINPNAFGARYRNVGFTERQSVQMQWRTSSSHNPAPQQLGADA